jgi:hypothetical protein
MKDLYLKIDEAFKKSDIHQRSIKNYWFYSLCTSIPKTGQPLIVGFNWAVDSQHKKQTYEDLKSVIDWDEMSSLNKIKPLIEKHFQVPEITPDEFNQTNFCFFRSKDEKDISRHDLKLCEPIFFEFISRIKPKIILAFSSKFRDVIFNNGMLKYLRRKSVFAGKREFTSYHGIVKFDGYWTNIYFLPHPSSWRFINDQTNTVSQLWEVCWKTYPYEIELTNFLNYLVSIGKNPSLSEDPLNEENIRSEIFTHDLNVINLSNVSFLQPYREHFKNIKNFDLFDITAFNRWLTSLTGKDKFKEYLTDRKSRLSNNEIIEKHFDKKEFEWSYNVTKIGLQKLYVYTKYINEYKQFKNLDIVKYSDS